LQELGDAMRITGCRVQLGYHRGRERWHHVGRTHMTSAEDEHWMRRALELARAGEAAGEGWNAPIGRCDPTAHAEIVALRSAANALCNYRLSGSTLYVSIEPCAMCAGALVHARVARVVFAAREPRAGAVASNLALLDAAFLNHRVAWSEGVCADEAARMMRDFFRRRRISP
jgi:tRNA(adenine34) deaminase